MSDALDQVTTEMLTKPLRLLTPTDRLLVRRALRTNGAALVARISDLHPERRVSSNLLLVDDYGESPDLIV